MNIVIVDVRLVPLCRGWKKWGTAKTVKPGTVILLSGADDVVPFAIRDKLIRDSGRLASALIEVGDNHRLAEPEPLRKLLEVCRTI